MKAAALVLAVLLSLAGGAWAAEPDPARVESLLADALKTYAEGQARTDRDARVAAFARSARLFAAVIERGVRTPDLYANLGTAALQAERLGTAILAFRRALALDPAHLRAMQNLVQARGLLPSWVPVPEPTGALDSLLFWRHRLPYQQRLAGAALAFLLGAVVLAVGIRYDARLARAAGLALLALWGALGVSILATHLAGADPHAVIVADEARARASDSPNAPARFTEPLPGGTEVTIAEERGDWARVVLADGRDAWVRRSALERVAGPAPAPPATEDRAG